MALDWRGFVRVAIGGFAGVLALLALVVLAMNPYGNLPRLVFGEHAIADSNQRFQYPALIRTRRFDSIVIGASDARLLKPHLLDELFGGRFANLAMNAAQAYEQYRVADLFIREVENPRTMLVALDHVWCREDALLNRTTFRGFPEWMYDGNRWNDFLYMLNATTVQTSARRLGVALGLRPKRFEAGYEVFTPPESKYDPVKVRLKLWGPDGPHKIEAEAYVASATERASWQFPALAWLEEILGRFKGRAVLVFMPAHAVQQPVPGSRGAAREEECKVRIAVIARRHGALPVIDFRIRSRITTDDANYWDPLHYRVSIADRIVKDIGEALASRADDPKGDWRLVTEGTVASIRASN
jgi:hypothetical protein